MARVEIVVIRVPNTITYRDTDTGVGLVLHNYHSLLVNQITMNRFKQGIH